MASSGAASSTWMTYDPVFAICTCCSCVSRLLLNV